MRELIVDNFAGGGGASAGIEAALGRPVDIAINHSPAAMAMHEANHPRTRHLIEDVFKVKPREATGVAPVGLAWFSPDCTHFSKAKGGKPVSKNIRGLAWVAVRWAKEARPRVIILENVEEFQDWGPLGPDNRPDPKRRGLTFRRFVGNLRGLGYNVEWRELVAADYGAPTTRKRLFLIARCDGHPIVWPEPTHRNPRLAEDFFASNLMPWRAAAECIDWSIPCPSIFERKRPLAEKTLARIAEGIRRYVIECADPFIVGIDNQSSGPGAAWSINDPLRTITKENRFALVAPHITKFRNGATGSPAGAPLPTITANSYINRPGGSPPLGLVTAFLSKFYGTNVGSNLRSPMPTVTGSGQHLAEVRAFLVRYYGNERSGVSPRAPLPTITSKDRMALVVVAGEIYEIADIGLRMLTPRELANAQGFPHDYVLTGTATSQVARIGNSVCPPVAEALVRANLPELALESNTPAQEAVA